MSRRKKKRVFPAYFVWREGRPRWEPGPRLRPAWHGRDLKSEAGEWLPMERAIAAANALNAEVAAWRAAGRGSVGSPRRAHTQKKHARSCRDLHDAWIASPEFRALAASTRRDYGSKARIFLDTFGDDPVAAIGRAMLKGYWREEFDRRGHTMANGIIAVARTMLTFACDLEWIERNPALELRLLTVPPRAVMWLPADVDAFCRIGDQIMPEVVDAVIIALHTGQRRGDVLALDEAGTEGGRLHFRQSKTKKRVGVPPTEQLASRLEAIRARRRSGAVVDLSLARRVVLRPDGRPYDADSFSRDFAAVREAVALKRPQVAALRFQDLRDTAVTRLALAGCTAMEIHAISGHDLETVHRIMKHYLATTEALADAAVRRLQAWLTAEGIAL